MNAMADNDIAIPSVRDTPDCIKTAQRRPRWSKLFHPRRALSF